MLSAAISGLSAKPDRCERAGGDRDRQAVVARRPAEVLPFLPPGAAIDRDRGGDGKGVGAHQHHVGDLDGNVSNGGDRDTDIGLGERGRVVDLSPTIATFRPCPCSPAILAALSPGRTSAITSVIPIWTATLSAVAWLSPVSTTARTPSWRSAAMPSLEVGRGVSAIAITPAAGREQERRLSVDRWDPRKMSCARNAPRPSGGGANRQPISHLAHL